MPGTKRNALGGAIDMTGVDGGSSTDPVDLNTISITTVTIPAVKRLKGSRKFRRHQESPNPTPAQDPLSSSSSTQLEGSENQPSASSHTEPSTVDSQQPTPETNEDEGHDEDNVEVHIGDEDVVSDLRVAPVRTHCCSIVSLCCLTYVCYKDPTKEWLPYRDICLDELLRHEGLGDRSEDEMVCEDCGAEAGSLRCADSHCVGALILCEPCMIRHHARLPLHRIQVRPLTFVTLIPV